MKKQAKLIEPEFMSVIDAETMSGMSRWTIRAWAYKGIISSTKCGTRLLIPVSEIRRVLAEGSRPRVEQV
jgi:hypothetical protein